MPEEAQKQTPLEAAEAACNKIRSELSRLQAQAKGIEHKIGVTEAKLEGAEEIVAALKAAQK